MTLLGLCLVIILAGVCVWAVVTYVPMAPPMKAILTAVVVIFLLLLSLQTFGVLGHVGSVRIR